jgi:ankyrin repeat protein
MVELLLAKGAYVDPEAHYGTPLHVAAMKDHDGAMKILLNHNADVSLSTYCAIVISLSTYCAKISAKNKICIYVLIIQMFLSCIIVYHCLIYFLFLSPGQQDGKW